MNNIDDEEMTTKIITQQEFMRMISNETNKRIGDTKKFYNAMEYLIKDILLNIKSDEKIVLKLFKGFSIEASLELPKKKLNNLTGETIVIDKKLRLKPKITNYFNEKIVSQIEDDYY